MNRLKKLLLIGAALLITAPGVVDKAFPQGTARNFSYRVWYATQWQVYRFATVEQAIAYRDSVMRSAAAGAYDVKVADFHTAPDGSIRQGPGPNPEVYIRQWLNNGSESDPHNAYTRLVALKRDASKPDTRVELSYDVPTAPTESLFPWVTRSVMLPELPGEFRQTEMAGSTVKGVWRLGPTGEMLGEWEDDSAGWLRLEYWDATQVIFTRRDVGGKDAGLTARYVGRFVGNTIVGEVTWTSKGQTWQGTWNASPGTWNIAKQPQQQAGKTCTRGEGTLVERGNAISVVGNSLRYTDPATRVTNTIQWNPPPESVALNQEITLLSWSTHNNGAPVEVRWETGSWRDHGADSLINESSKQSKLKFTGGRIDLVGGIRSSRSGGPGHFVMRWQYTCP